MAHDNTPLPTFEPEVIDAKGQVLGRLATQVAHKLLGKDLIGFDPSVALVRPITVKNARFVEVTGRKADQKVYHRHTGYPGGLRTRSYKELKANNPTEIVRHAVRGMLPKNRLQTPRMKHLTILAEEEK